MMQQTNLPIKLEKTKSLITPRAGLVLIEKTAKDLNLSQLLNLDFGQLKKRKKGLSVSRQILDLACLLIDGGTRIEDIEQLQDDEGWQKMRGEEETMAARTALDFLHRFTQEDLGRFEKLHRQYTQRVAKNIPFSEIATLDADATFVEAHKKEAQYSYHKLPGYYPMLGFWAEPGLVVNGEFRQGNENPGSHALAFLKGCLEGIPEGVKQLRLRSDSAWYQAEVMDFCQQQKIEFAIGGKRHEAAMQAIDQIKPDQWETLTQDEEELKQHPKRKDWQIAETVHSLEFSTQSYRVVVIRKPYPQLEIFTGEVYEYDLIITNMDWEKRRLTKWYWERCTSENWIKELKYGFGLNQFPCSKYLPNGAYFHLTLLAHNLVQAFKRIQLTPDWHYVTVKTLRYHFFHVAGLLVRHARRLILKLFFKFPHYDSFHRILYPLPT